MVKRQAKALCLDEKRPNSHVTPSWGIITAHALMPSLGVKKQKKNKTKQSIKLISFDNKFSLLDIAMPH